MAPNAVAAGATLPSAIQKGVGHGVGPLLACAKADDGAVPDRLPGMRVRTSRSPNLLRSAAIAAYSTGEQIGSRFRHVAAVCETLPQRPWQTLLRVARLG